MKDVFGKLIAVGDWVAFARKVGNSAVLGFGRVEKTTGVKITVRANDRHCRGTPASAVSLGRSEAVVVIPPPEPTSDLPADVQQN